MDWLQVIEILVPIMIVVALAVLAIVAIKMGYKKQVAEIIFYLVCKAENELSGEGGTGQLKFAAVVTWVYERLPWYLRLFITDKMLDDLIEEAVQRMKDWLASNARASSLITGGGSDGGS